MKAQIFEHSAWVKCEDDERLVALLATGIEYSKHTVLRHIAHSFVPQGTTALWLLAESHLALHTWPEHGIAYVQLSSCNEAKFNEFVAWLGEHTEVVENN